MERDPLLSGVCVFRRWKAGSSLDFGCRHELES